MGRKNPKKLKQHKIGDFVFAKVRGYRPWPARILRKEREGRIFCVYFYGTCNIGKVGRDQIYEYEKYATRLGDPKQRRYSLFRDAMADVQKSLPNPDKDYGYFEAKASLAGEQVSEGSATSQSSAKLPFIHITGDSD